MDTGPDPRVAQYVVSPGWRSVWCPEESGSTVSLNLVDKGPDKDKHNEQCIVPADVLKTAQ